MAVVSSGVDARRELGRRGEELAAQFLESRGLVVLQRNWRCREGELDIVATDGLRTLHICEVKTRSGEGFGLAESVTAAKRQKIRRLARLWLIEHQLRWPIVHFDVIGVLWRPGTEPELEYLPEAF